MPANVTSDEILRIFRTGSAEELRVFLDACPPRPELDAALALAGSDELESRVLVLGVLSQAYSYGQDCALGVEIARAGHELAREVFGAQGAGGPLLLSTVSMFAAHLIHALILLGRFEEADQFAAEVIPFHEALGETANLPSIRTGRIEALVGLHKIDEAKALLNQEKARPRDWVAGINLDRLEKKIRQLTQPVTNLPPPSTPIDPAAGDALLPHLEEMRRLLVGSGSELNEWKANEILEDADSILRDPTEGQDPLRVRQVLEELIRLRPWAAGKGDVERDVLWRLYICNRRLERFSEAADALGAFWDNIENLRLGIKNPMERGGVSSQYPHFFPALCEMLAKSNRPAELLDAIEGSKGRAVAAKLTERLGHAMGDKEFCQPGRKLPQLLRESAAHYVSFFVNEECTYAVLVGKDGSLHYAGSLPVGKEKIRHAAENVDPRLWGKRDPADPISGALVEDVSATLSPLVSWLEPYLDAGLIQEGDHVCYSPDEHLHHIPLHLVRLRGQPLVRYLSISRVHGAYALALILEGNPHRPASCIAVVVPFEENLKDAEFLHSLNRVPSWLYKHRGGEIVANQNATAGNLARRELGGRVVHFATHGIFPGREMPRLDPNPFHSSGLVLADNQRLASGRRVAAGEDDHFVLTPERVLDLNLNFANSHVSMQACVSGLAREGIGGDALGLEWALMQTGAASILSSHWSVSASLSAEFFERFYDLWLTQGGTRSYAWRQTILEMLDSEDPVRSSPYCWGAFSLAGDWR